MTYPPGSSGYPPGFYGATAPSFAKSVGGEKPQPYLTGAVIVLGLLAYLASYGKMFTTMLPGGEELVQTGGGFPVAAALLAALLAATGLLPKAKSYAPVVAAISALGALMLVENTVSASGRGWALWFVLACTVLQACAAAGVVLLDAGVISAAMPQPRYDQYSQYGQYGGQPGGYYGRQQMPYSPPGPQQSGYGSPYSGYSSAPPTGGFGSAGSQQSQSGPQQGTPTPPTGFPSFSPPPSTGSGSDPSGQAHEDSGSQGGQAHDPGPQSSSSGQPQS
ncbi:DUF5336 domain-containing protein [Mycobacterium sp.]|uniref:DUF5336 domain-containing protein n=1 Tax=Mycobacterium sp. TaxID=1785 RepID=UPI0012726932|nr:DUF5336 domain-containing protein [Mycobacterium sp.]KAA8968824.1 MAG: hypothetical protein F6Q13_04630 [Mycobacterium sp.]